MPKVIYVRCTTAEHGLILDAVRNSRSRSLQSFALDAILEATDRWAVDRPPIAEAALESSGIGDTDVVELPEDVDSANVVPGPDDFD